MKKKVVPKLRQVVKVDIVTSDDIKIYYTWKFQVACIFEMDVYLIILEDFFFTVDL